MIDARLSVRVCKDQQCLVTWRYDAVRKSFTPTVTPQKQLNHPYVMLSVTDNITAPNSHSQRIKYNACYLPHHELLL